LPNIANSKKKTKFQAIGLSVADLAVWTTGYLLGAELSLPF